MEIKIIKDDNDDLLNRNMIKWNLTNRRNLFYFCGYALFGALILVMAAVPAKNSGDFWGVWSSLGLALIFLAAYYFLHTLKNRRKFREGIIRLILLRKPAEQHSEVVINDIGVTISDFQSYREFKWIMFTQYMFYRDYLFLIIGGSVLSSVTIRKNEITDKDFNELLNFCRGKLFLKKP